MSVLSNQRVARSLVHRLIILVYHKPALLPSLLERPSQISLGHSIHFD